MPALIYKVISYNNKQRLDLNLGQGSGKGSGELVGLLLLGNLKGVQELEEQNVLKRLEMP